MYKFFDPIEKTDRKSVLRKSGIKKYNFVTRIANLNKVEFESRYQWGKHRDISISSCKNFLWNSEDEFMNWGKGNKLKSIEIEQISSNTVQS